MAVMTLTAQTREAKNVRVFIVGDLRGGVGVSSLEYYKIRPCRSYHTTFFPL